MLKICLLIVIVSACLLSCRHEPVQPEPGSPYPEIVLVQETGCVWKDTVLEPAGSFCLNVYAKAGRSAGLSHLKITRMLNNIGSKLTDTIINTKEISWKCNCTAALVEGKEMYSFNVKDDGGLAMEKNIIITTVSLPGTPVLRFLTGDGFRENATVADLNEQFTIGFRAWPREGTGALLTGLEIIHITDLGNTTVLDSTFTTDTIRYDHTYTTSDFVGQEYWKHIVTAGNDETSFACFYVNVQRFLKVVRSGVIWNTSGASTNVWDMVQHISCTGGSNDSVKDMIMTMGEEAGVTIAGWESQNGTLYKRDVWFDYDNATEQTTVDAITGGTITGLPKPYTYNVSEDDVYLVQIRNRAEYAVIKVTDVHITANDDLDRIGFEYRKAE
ncbi:MAG: hypothetical protein KJ607_04685 [Bacteroidetes bacterium]|nr:hypothetical protein [Bacteroidota bacterium]